MSIVFLAAITLAGTKDLAAQRRPQSTKALEPGVVSDHPDFIGSWSRGPTIGLDESKDCSELRNALGTPAIRCSVPFNKIKSILHPRAFAWLQFVDERLSTKWYCARPTVPVALDMGITTFSQVSGGEMEVENTTWANPTRRTVWMDGRTHPPLQDLFYQGDTIGWYEGGDLILETANFTFDADGLEDHTHLPSSILKKVTERYKKIAPDKISVTVTYEDPLFLKAPYSWSWESKKAPRPEGDYSTCDPDDNEAELELTAPDKYQGK